MARPDPEFVIRRIIVLIMGVIGVGAGAIAVTACVRGFFVHGDSPLMLVGILGGVLGIAAGLYFAWIAFNPGRALRR